MFRHVMVAYDGSERAQDALALALRLRHPDGHLTLACALTAPEDVDFMLAAARARVPLGIHVALRAPVSTSPARALTELAEADHADLVVVGSSSRISDGRIRLERTAGRLLQGAPCAVAVAPPEWRSAEPFRHVGIAYDGSPEARVALAAGYGIAHACGAAVTVAYAEPGGGAQDPLDEAAEAAPDGMRPRTLLLHGPPAGAIARACERVVDLLVCGSRGYGPIERALMGSVAEALMEGAPHPVLVLPRRAAPTVSAPATATVEA